MDYLRHLFSATTDEERQALLDEEFAGKISLDDIRTHVGRERTRWIVVEVPADGRRREVKAGLPKFYLSKRQADAEIRRRNKAQPLEPGRSWEARPLRSPLARWLDQ